MKVGLTIGVRRLPQDERPMQELYRDCLEPPCWQRSWVGTSSGCPSIMRPTCGLLRPWRY